MPLPGARILHRASLPLLASLVLLPSRSVMAQEAQSQSPMSRESAAAFDRTDRLARTLISTIRCAQSAAGHRARGAFGPVDSVGRMGLCMRTEAGVLGVFLDTDSTFRMAAPLRAVDLRSGARYVGRVDTSAAIAQTRASWTGVRAGMAPFVDAKRQFAPLSLRFDGDSIEVWILPTSSLAGTTVGGERGFVYSPDGVTMVREINHFDRSREFTVPPQGPVEIRSTEPETPALGELLLANLLHAAGRQVSIVTARFRTNLVGPGDNSAWIHVPIKP